MASTLIIGLGTTGLSIIEEAQQFHYEFTRRNKPGNNVEYIYIETDISKKSRNTASGKTDIEQIEFGLGSNAVDINQLKENPFIDNSWLPEATRVLQNLSGAGGMPSYGRLALWGSANYRNFKDTIKDKYHKIRGNNETQILIVGTLTGGTGAGLCVDIAYLVKDITKNPNINGIFLLPDGNSFGGAKPMHENSFSALSAILHYSKPENNYTVTWPDGSSTLEIGPPFQFVQFLSQDFTGAKASISTLGELVRVAGMITTLQILDTEIPGTYFYNLLSRRRVDSVGNNRIRNMISGGFYMVQFPKAQLEELLAIKISEELLNSLINPKEFVDKFENKKDITGEKTIIQNSSKLRFEEILQACFNVIDSVNTSTGNILPQSLKYEVEKVIKKNHGKSSDKRFYYDLFSTKQAGNYFELIKNNSSLIKDTLVEEIFKFFSETTKQYKNLHITKIVLQELRTYISQIVKFYYNQYEITGSDTDWDGLLQRTIDKFDQNNSAYSIIGQKQSYLEFTFQEIANMAKMHILVPVLNQLQEDLINPPVTVRNIAGHELPNERSIDSIIFSLDTVLRGDGTEGSYTLKRRKNELNIVLERFSSCFKMVYAYDSKEGDLKVAYNNYINDQSNRLKYDDLFLSDNIWSYLNKKELNLYSDCIANSNSFIHNKKYFSNTSLNDILLKIKPDSIDNQTLLNMFDQPVHKIKENVPGMIKLKEGTFAFGHDSSAKLYVITNDHMKYNTTFNEYRVSLQDDNTIDLPSLTDAIIFYQEYGYMGDVGEPYFNPINHIGKMGDVKAHIKTKLNDDFKKTKIPYLTLEQIKHFLS